MGQDLGPTKKRSRHKPEDAIQKAVFEHIDRRAVPGAIFWHVPNQGRRGGLAGLKDGARYKALGLRPGWPDINALHDGKFFALELKAMSGRSTEIQMLRRMEINAAGGFAAEAMGLNAALACLESWGLLKPDKSMSQFAARSTA